MDRTEAFEIIALARSKVPEAEQAALDSEYATSFMGIATEAGSATVAETVAVNTVPTSETPSPEEQTITSEGLLANIESALKKYG